jgi:ParB family chromosome partitioning protein
LSVERLAGLLDERRLEIVIRQHGIKREKDSDSIAKLIGGLTCAKADESVFGSVLVELTILLLSMRSPTDTAKVLREAAQTVQGGHRCHLREGQTGIRGEGQGESSEEGCAQANSQATGKTAKKSAAA